MVKQKLQLLMMACVVAGGLCVAGALSVTGAFCASAAGPGASAANDPFVGDWKLNPSKSQLADEMKVGSAGENKYTFDFSGDGSNVETIVADGTDQPGLSGTTLAVTVQGPDTWNVVRKEKGRMLLTGTWNLSNDGNTLTDDYTEVAENGSRSTVR
jgi:hypothetical protein